MGHKKTLREIMQHKVQIIIKVDKYFGIVKNYSPSWFNTNETGLLEVV